MKQAEVLDLMMDSLREHQRYPTLCEMAKTLHITPNALIGRLELLERKGWITRDAAKARSYRIPGLVVDINLPDQTWGKVPVPGTSVA